MAQFFSKFLNFNTKIVEKPLILNPKNHFLNPKYQKAGKKGGYPPQAFGPVLPRGGGQQISTQNPTYATGPTTVIID